MYHAPKESRPFCERRYELSRAHLPDIVTNLGTAWISHARRGSYATVRVLDKDGTHLWYYVPFKVFRQQKKFRIHITSAYPMDKKPGGEKVGFFTIARNLRNGKKLPKPKK